MRRHGYIHFKSSSEVSQTNNNVLVNENMDGTMINLISSQLISEFA